MQAQRRTFKTKMCNLYQKGRCSRHNCNFAHGDAELKRFGGGSHSFNGRRDYRDDDLRARLERRHSPNRRYSPERDARNRRGFHGQRTVPRGTGNSRSRSPTRTSERSYRRREPSDEYFDDNNKMPDSALNRKNEDRASPYDDKRDQLKRVQSEIERLEDDKSQLQNFLDEKVDETHRLSLRIEELETQLNKEQKECNRVISKVRKFVRAHGTYLKAQEELKRSQALLQKLGDQLCSDISKPGDTDEDANFNMSSDDGTKFDNRRSPRNIQLKNDISSIKKRSYVSSVANDTQIGNPPKRGRYSCLVARPPAQSEYNDNKEIESNMENQTKKHTNRSTSNDYSYKRGRNNGSEKAKHSDGRGSMPSTSIAAHEDEDITNSVDLEDTNDNVNVDKEVIPSNLPPPPPPVDLNAYKQHDENDKNVDMGKGESEMLDIDLNDEVDIV